MTDQGYGQGQPYGAGQGQAANYPTQQAYPAQGGAGQGAGYGGQAAGYGGQGAGYGAGQGGYQGGMPFPAPGASDAKGFVASLFDTSFSSFVTPKVIRVVYVIIMIVIAIETLGYIGFGFISFHLFGIIFLPIALLIGLVSLAIARMSFELIMVIFRIGDDMHAMRTNNR